MSQSCISGVPVGIQVQVRPPARPPGRPGLQDLWTRCCWASRDYSSDWRLVSDGRKKLEACEGAENAEYQPQRQRHHTSHVYLPSISPHVCVDFRMDCRCFLLATGKSPSAIIGLNLNIAARTCRSPAPASWLVALRAKTRGPHGNPRLCLRRQRPVVALRCLGICVCVRDPRARVRVGLGLRALRSLRVPRFFHFRRTRLFADDENRPVRDARGFF